MTADLDELLLEAMQIETANLEVRSDAVPRAVGRVRRRRRAIASTVAVAVVVVAAAGGSLYATRGGSGSDVMATESPPAAVTLPLTAGVQHRLITAFATAQHIKPSAVASVDLTGAHFGRMSTTGVRWAAVGFLPSSTAGSSAKAAFQDGPFVFTRIFARGWSAWGLLTDSGGQLCPSEVPSAMAAVWRLPSASGCKPGTAAYSLYYSGRFKFSVPIPADFKETSPQQDGDGLEFHSVDRSATLSAGGANNVDHQSPAHVLRSLKAGYRDQHGKITYSTVIGRIVAVSGTTRSGRVFYDREVVDSAAIYGLKWSYPATDQSIYQPMVNWTVDHFEPGPNASD